MVAADSHIESTPPPTGRPAALDDAINSRIPSMVGDKAGSAVQPATFDGTAIVFGNAAEAHKNAVNGIGAGSLAKNISAAAEKAVGSEIWKDNRLAVDTIKKYPDLEHVIAGSSAASISAVLKQAGAGVHDQVSNVALEQDLKNAGWSVVKSLKPHESLQRSDLQPGDVLIRMERQIGSGEITRSSAYLMGEGLAYGPSASGTFGSRNSSFLFHPRDGEQIVLRPGR